MNRLITRNVASIILCAAMALGLAANQAVAQDKDKVFPLKGVAVTGKIVERTRDKVVIEVRGSNQSFQTNEVARVVFDGEPQSLTRVKDYVALGQVDQAIDELKKIDANSIKEEVIKQDYLFYRSYLAAANALRGKGDPAASTKLLVAWASDNKTSHHFYQASERLGELAMAMGAADQANKYFSVIAGAPFPELKAKGNYLSGKALLAQKQVAEAKAKFEAVAQAQVSDPASLRLKKLASVSAIRCDATQGQNDQAIAALEKMVDEGDSNDAELYSELYNALGGIFQSVNKNDEAVLSFLKTDLLYATQTEAHAEALYHLSQLWPLVGDNQRAMETKSRLSKLYPTSPWLQHK